MSNGVVHVGAHKGEEVPQYIEEGFDSIICFDPQELNRINDDRVMWVKCALGNITGKFILRIPHHLSDKQGMDTQSASMLPLIDARAKYIGWTPTPCEEVLIDCYRFDEWVGRWQLNHFSLLVIDVQGMEMQVLQGFGKYLSGFEKIKVECSSPPVYEGGVDAKEVASFLAELGFDTIDPIPSHGDMTFRRTQ